jgi:hypothetical protein
VEHRQGRRHLLVEVGWDVALPFSAKFDEDK